MPSVDMPLDSLTKYLGTNPKPKDFDAFWDEALAELDLIEPEPRLDCVTPLGSKNFETFDLSFTSVGGARIYAKFLRPVYRQQPRPALLLFHPYGRNSGDWNDKLPFLIEGFSVAAMDCRGQSGRSEDIGIASRHTFGGHIVRGLCEGPKHLLFRNIFLDTVQLARVLRSFQDTSAVYCMGSSQGGGLAIACAALDPRIERCVSLYPFLSDYKRVWEMNLAEGSYAELKSYLRTFDPLHKNGTFEKLGYIDVHHLALRIKADVLMGITLMDKVSPPSTQFAVFNNIKSRKDAEIYPDYAHEAPPGFYDRAFAFLARGNSPS